MEFINHYLIIHKLYMKIRLRLEKIFNWCKNETFNKIQRIYNPGI